MPARTMRSRWLVALLAAPTYAPLHRIMMSKGNSTDCPFRMRIFPNANQSFCGLPSGLDCGGGCVSGQYSGNFNGDFNGSYLLPGTAPPMSFDTSVPGCPQRARSARVALLHVPKAAGLSVEASSTCCSSRLGSTLRCCTTARTGLAGSG